MAYISQERVSLLTDAVVELNDASQDQSWKAKKNRINLVMSRKEVGKDIRAQMFDAIQREMSRRSAAKSKADAAARRAMEKFAS
ncbi:MAG: hypothetical protein AAB288_10805 [Acidobacteriota bacterium]